MDFSSIHELYFGETVVYVVGYRNYDINKYVDELSQIEKERLAEISHPVKRMEFVAIRKLKKHVFGDVDVAYDEVGAPLIDKIPEFISFSHTNHMVGLAKAPYKVGLDLEPIASKARKIHKRFLSEREQSVFDIESDEEMTKTWSAKEALYKLAGRREISFKKELELYRDSEKSWTGVIINPNEKRKVRLHFSTSDDNILTVNSSAHEII